MSTDTEKLKAQALAATQGPWYAAQTTMNTNPFYIVPAVGTGAVAMIPKSKVKPLKANAEFIAAVNPAAVLVLIDELEHLREVMKWRDRALRLINHAYGVGKDDDADTAQAKAQAVRLDAERYRFIRNENLCGDLAVRVVLHNTETRSTVFLHGENTDSQVDQAMKSSRVRSKP